jgi:pyruvate,orthophosphate dikinase
MAQTEATPRAVATERKWVYLFEESDASQRDLLGGKGAGLSGMASAGLPVPPGFTITTEACNAYFESDNEFPIGMWDQALAALKVVEQRAGKGFGDPSNPLLVSVRSGARISMPGMMDTVLNLGLNRETLSGLIALTGNERFGFDAYRRFIQMFGRIVMDVEGAHFDEYFDGYKQRVGANLDTELTARNLEEIAEEFLAIFQRETGREFPSDPLEQLHLAIGAVFTSWMGKRAVDYRRAEKIPDDLGTAVNVQTMVFGNMGEDSGTGVAFTRDPNTGEHELYGNFLPDAQGEDVVAGIRTPLPLAAMKESMPDVYEEFGRIASLLEQTYKDMQDLEFTVERRKLYMLQTRSGKRSGKAAVKIATDMVSEGLISKEDAILKIEGRHVEQFLLPRLDENVTGAARTDGRLLAHAVGAAPGAAVGEIVFDPDRAEHRVLLGARVVLVRPETSPDDVHGMIVAEGVLTGRGGTSSHAAVVARGLGKPCVVGAEGLQIDLRRRHLRADGRLLKEGDLISIDGSTGEVFSGAIPTIVPNIEEEHELQEILKWADERRSLGVWANADYPRDARRAITFGAEGIGLCRTEHMFMETDRLPIVRQMILNAEAGKSNPEARREYLDALARLLEFQRGDFQGILRAMSGRSVIIRLIDPPLHEFLPKYEDLLVDYATRKALGEDPSSLEEAEALLKTVESLRESNPMLGLRGCRLGLLYPEINEMQVRAILEAAVALKKERLDPRPKIMIPLVSDVRELRRVRDQLESVAHEVMERAGTTVEYKFGTMIEVPRAALTAEKIAEVAEFFSFGTNDLTQATFGYSRDDAEGKFLAFYLDEKILTENPFQVLDREGVGNLINLAVTNGRKSRPGLETGICGEHGGDPSSIEFCHQVGLDYVSASPFRVPVARLAAAQAALRYPDVDRPKR